MELQTLTTPKKVEQAFKNHEEILVHYICEMDIAVLDLLLDSKRHYQKLKKEKFITLLGRAFEKFKEEGNTRLMPFKGHCKSETCPNMRGNGHTFIGNHANSYLSLIILTENEIVSDIYQCYDFKCLNEQELSGKEISILHWSEELSGNY